MKKLITITLIAIIILSLLTFLTNSLITGRVTQSIEEYTYTTAICNESNFCQDHLITCKGNQTISINPITSATIQHPKNWKDPRKNSKLCG